MCYDEGTLQAYLDNELNITEKHKIEAHLAACSECRQILQELQKNNFFTTARVSAYINNTDANHQITKLPVIDIEQLNLLSHKQNEYPEVTPITNKGVVPLMHKYRKVMAGAAAVALLAGSMAISPVRAMAGDFLKIFRVEKIQSVQINPDELRSAAQVFYEAKKDLKIDNFGEFSNDMKTGQMQEIGIEEAKKAVDFNLKLPQYMPAEFKHPIAKVALQPEKNINFKLNVKNVNAMLKYLGSQKLLPVKLDGQTFTLHIPVMAQYNNFTEPTDENKESFSLNITQSKSPEFVVPDGVDPKQIRDAILDLPLIPSDVKQQLNAIDDWQHTLPVPTTDTISRQVDINGAKGFYAGFRNSLDNGTLVFQKDGVITIIDGHLPYEEKVKIAKSMR